MNELLVEQQLATLNYFHRPARFQDRGEMKRKKEDRMALTRISHSPFLFDTMKQVKDQLPR